MPTTVKQRMKLRVFRRYLRTIIGTCRKSLCRVSSWDDVGDVYNNTSEYVGTNRSRFEKLKTILPVIRCGGDKYLSTDSPSPVPCSLYHSQEVVLILKFALVCSYCAGLFGAVSDVRFDWLSCSSVPTCTKERKARSLTDSCHHELLSASRNCDNLPIRMIFIN